MRYLYRFAPGARRRVMHLTGFDPMTGKPTMQALCGLRYPFNTTINVPLGQRVCKRCRAAAA
ncbi:MAG: hypothetical protein J2P30_00445 [Actinobacteria bacterium]|nr:hypothetical protein [Actinomycetota bacterium]